MLSHALVRFGSSEESGPLPLIVNPPPNALQVQIGPGRILFNAYRSIGQSLESTANHLAYRAGLGPIAVTEKIEQQFGGSLNRQEKLDLLFATGRASCTQEVGLNIKQIKKWCRELMQKYAHRSVLYQFNFLIF